MVEAAKASHLQAVGSALTRLTTARPTKHLAWLQYDRKLREQTPGLVQAENMARRLSALSVAEHLEYVTLQKKRADAQRHGLPAVLALTPTESEALSRLKKLLREEQREFRRGLEVIACKDEATRYTTVPPFVEDWFQCWMQTCHNQVQHLYPRLFEPQSIVSLGSSGIESHARNHIKLKFVQEVHRQGDPFVIP
ncbi:hypothetical protein PINS_up023472, partial [Pythium insidiosum]